MNFRHVEENASLSSRYEQPGSHWKSIQSGYITTERDGY